MQQNNYQTELANMIKRVDFYSNRFSKLAVTCSYQDLNTIKSTVKMSDRKLDKGFNTSKSVSQRVRLPQVLTLVKLTISLLTETTL